MQNLYIVLWLSALVIAGCNRSDHWRNSFSVAQAGYAEAGQEEGWEKLAKEMVEKQITSRGVKDKRVLQVMETTPRHKFVPGAPIGYAYQDGPLPIGEGQTISQPYIVALMTELLQLDGDETVLEIGTGSGYQAAILAQLAKEVYSIEIVESLARKSKALLEQMNYDNVTVRWGDGYQGWPEHAPFDAIILTAAPDKTPPKLLEQLKPGGIMVLPVGSYSQELKVITRQPDGSLKERTEAFVRFVPMVHPRDKNFDNDP